MDAKALGKLLSTPNLATYQEHLEASLWKSVAASNELTETVQPLLKRGGKRLRPLLLITIAQYGSKKINQKTLSAATGVELLHLASLVHDDIIDRAASRHGTATINIRHGDNMALLVGDYLISQAFRQTAEAGVEAVNILSETFSQMCAGQSREIKDRFNLKRTLNSYYTVTLNKTGALMGAASRLGGLQAGLAPKKVTALGSYGENFGVSFQLIDDLMDLISSSAAQGKPVGNDLKEGNYTLPVLLSLRNPSGSLRKYIAKSDHKNIMASLVKDGSITKTAGIIKEYNRTAVKSLAPLGNSNLALALEKLPDYYLKWARQKTRPVYRNCL